MPDLLNLVSTPNRISFISLQLLANDDHTLTQFMFCLYM